MSYPAARPLIGYRSSHRTRAQLAAEWGVFVNARIAVWSPVHDEVGTQVSTSSRSASRDTELSRRRTGHASDASQSSCLVRLRPWNDGSSYPRAQLRNALKLASSTGPLCCRRRSRASIRRSRSAGSRVRNTTASQRATMLSPHPSIEPERTQASRGRNICSMSATRSPSGRLSTNGGSVGIQK